MTGPGVLIWCQMDTLIDGLSAQLVVVHPLLCPVLGTTALPLSLPIILSQPPPMLGFISGSLVACPVSPPLPSPVPLVCVYCHEHGHSVWQYHDYNRPCSPNSSQVNPSTTAAADSLPIPNSTPIPSSPPLPKVTSNQKCTTIPRK